MPEFDRKELGFLTKEQITSYIVDAIPYPVVFVDCDHIIRYMNKAAKYHYYEERGYRDLIGKSLFDCHQEERSKEHIIAAVEKLKKHANEVFLMVGVKNQRIYINPVRDENGELIGYFARYELHLQK